MATNQMWNSHGDDEERLRLLDFIDPDSEALNPILNAAQQHMACITKQLSGQAFDELAACEPPDDWLPQDNGRISKWIKCRVWAIYKALKDQNIAFGTEDWKSTLKEQWIPTHEELLQHRQLGDVCLPLVLLMAACLRKIGLQPLVIILDEKVNTQGKPEGRAHAILGYWLGERPFHEKMSAGDVQPLFNRKSDFESLRGRLGLEIEFVQCPGITRGQRDSYDFETAQRVAKGYWNSWHIRFILDVKAARETALSREMRKYLEQVQADALTLPPAFRFPPAASFPKIRVQVKVRKEPRRFSEAEARAWETARRESLDEESTRQVYQYPHPWPEEWDREAERPLDWDREVRGRLKRAVVLGDPGFGKTWLLKHEALKLAEEALQKLKEHPLATSDIKLPIFLSLAQLAAQTDKRGRPLPLKEALLVALEERYPIGKELKEWIAKNLNSERVVLLLDALDEVIPSKRQQELCNRLDDFARKYNRTQILLTSRLVGYPGLPLPLPPREGEFELLPFDRRQQREFVKAWFAGRPDRGDLFLRKLRESPQVHALAVVPLLLALMCQLFDERGELPRSRADLYEACVWSILTRKWKEWKEERTPRSEDNPYLHAKLRLLEEVAYELFVAEEDSFYLDDLLDVIEVIFRSQPRLEQNLQNKSPADVIAELQEDGLLIKAGAGENPPYLFLHLTFQEYLTTCALARRTTPKPLDGLDGKEVPEWLAIVEPHLFDPRWEEVIRLLAGMQDDATFLVQFLLKAKDDIFHHLLLLAGKCCADAQTIAESVKREVVSRLLLFWKRGALPQLKRMTSLRPKIEQALAPLVARDAQLADELASLIPYRGSFTEPSDRRWSVLRILTLASGYGTTSPRVRDTFLRAMLDMSERWTQTRNAAAFALIRVASPEDDQVAQTLLDVVKDSGADPQIRGLAASVLAELTLDRVIPVLIEILRGVGPKPLGDLHPLIRTAAAEILQRVNGAQYVEVLKESFEHTSFTALVWTYLLIGGPEPLKFISRINSPEETKGLVPIRPYPPSSVTIYLRPEEVGRFYHMMRVLDGNLSIFWTEITTALGMTWDPRVELIVRMLRDRLVLKESYNAAGFNFSEWIMQWMDSVMAELEDKETCRKAVGTAVNSVDSFLGLCSENRVRTLLTLAQAGQDWAREKLVDYIQAGKDHENDVLLTQAALALAELGDPRGREGLISSLEHRSEAICLRAAKVLGEIGGQASCNALVACLNKAVLQGKNILAHVAAWTLGKLRCLEAIDPLLQLVDNPEPWVRWGARLALCLIADPTLTSHYKRFLEDPLVRAPAAEALSRIGDKESIKLLIRYLTTRGRSLNVEDDAEIRERIYKALEHLSLRIGVPIYPEDLEWTVNEYGQFHPAVA